MKNIVVALTGTTPGTTNWLPVDSDQASFNLGLACVISGTVNYTVQYTLDDINVGGDQTLVPGGYNGNFAPQWLTTTAYTLGAFVLNAGNIYQAQNSATSGATAPTSTQSNLPSSDGAVNWKFVGKAPTGFAITALTAQTSSVATNLVTPVKAVRLVMNSGTGTATLTVAQGLKA